MKYLVNLMLLLMLTLLSGCEVVGDIFSLGFYTGLFVVILVIAIIIFLVVKMRGRR